MGETVYIAPLKQGLSLGEMISQLGKGHQTEFRGAVVLHGKGMWDKEIWETSEKHPSGRKLGNLSPDLGPAAKETIMEALGRNKLVLYAGKYRRVVYDILMANGYQPIELAYESRVP